jgi:cytochrome b561
MTANSTHATRYDAVTIWLHWVTAILVVEQWIGAKTIDMWEGPLRVDARSVHIAFGISLGFILLFRLAWRATQGRALPNADSGLLGLASKAMHWGLYALVAAIIGLGVALLVMRGDSIFGLFRVPIFVQAARPLRHTIQDLHETLATIVLIAAGLHAAAALFHRYVLKDGVLARMGFAKSRPAG